MFNLIFGVVFIVLGIMSLYLAFRLHKSKDITLIKNNMVKVEKVKDKEGYLKFNFRINILLGTVYIINGVTSILSTYFTSIENISSDINLITVLTIFVYFYKLMFKAPKFQQ